MCACSRVRRSRIRSIPSSRRSWCEACRCEAACSWRELRCGRSTARHRDRESRPAIVHRGFRREFIGFNRARHAVLEAAIYATRVHMLAREFPRVGACAPAGDRGQDRWPGGAGSHGASCRVHPLCAAFHRGGDSLGDDRHGHRRGACTAPFWPARSPWSHRGGDSVALARRHQAISVRVSVSRADAMSGEGDDAERAMGFARRFLEYHGLSGGARFVVERAIPPHSGLGSGTQLALSVARALAELHGVIASPPDLARAVGRAKRSAVGTWTFAGGGFVVEGGRRTGLDDNAGPLLARQRVPQLVAMCVGGAARRVRV